MDSTFYLGSKKRAMTGQLLRLAHIGVNTRARVFFLTAKNEWINWAIINYPIIASEKLTLPYSKIEEKKKKISSANLKKCFIINQEEPSGSPVYYPVEEKLVENHNLYKWYWTFTCTIWWLLMLSFMPVTTYIPMMILLPTRYSIVWLLSWLPNILYRRLDNCFLLSKVCSLQLYFKKHVSAWNIFVITRHVS